MKDAGEIREMVRERYGAIAEGAGGCGCGCGPAAGTKEEGAKGEAAAAGTSGCCGSGETSLATMEQIGYSAEQAAAAPKEADLGLGCGNPLGFADARPGETVLDLGSGAGIDAFLAAREVGPKGRVIGVDMTHAMLSRARATAAREGYANVDFRLGEIEHLPVADATVDVIISNCVINLSPDKDAVFAEAFRVLKPGGRLAVSDIVTRGTLPEAVRRSVEAWAGCIAGALDEDEYLRKMRNAGFVDVRVEGSSVYGPEVLDEAQRDSLTELLGGQDAAQMGNYKIVSARVVARKPA